MALALLPDSFDTERGCGNLYTARQQSMGSGTSGVVSERRPTVSADDSNRVLLYRTTRPGRNVQVATSLYTLDHNQQDRTNFNGTGTRQAEHIS
jgi:hypothetical protein